MARTIRHATTDRNPTPYTRPSPGRGWDDSEARSAARAHVNARFPGAFSTSND